MRIGEDQSRRETAQSVAEENIALRRAMRELVSLASLPAVWIGYRPAQIIENLADVLLRTADLDCVYLRIESNGAPLVAASAKQRAADSTNRIRALMDALIASGQPVPEMMPDPLAGDRMLRTLTLRLGDGAHDILFAASAREGFPTEIDRLLLGIGANQTTVVLRRMQIEQALEQSESAVREQNRALEKVSAISRTLSAELDLGRLVQSVTDAATELSGAEFGAFFYNVVNEQGEAYLLFALSGAPREAFEKFGTPRNTPLFGPTFRGQGPVRIADVLADPRYGKNPPHHGMPPGHLPVRSYLAVPVVSRSGEVLGGLFFGHPEPGVFTEHAEQMIVGIAAQTAIAIDNARFSNAVKFTPVGGVIQIRVVRASSFGVIEVRDTGEGIPADFLPLVFERHTQAGSRRFGGLGLGLAIVKHIVELHGGSVAAESAGEGKGASFIVRIPAAAR